jgi:pimeloyl-ACP methyl ester carboxylesterase
MTDTQPTVFEPEGRAIPFVDEGNGPAVVLLPAEGLGVSYLGMLASTLVEEDFRVLRIGSRRTSGDAASLTFHDLAQDVVDVMDAVGLTDAWLGGHAFGGAVARTVSLDHHDHVNGVLLLGVSDATPAAADAVLQFPEEARDAEAAAVHSAVRAGAAAGEWSALAAGVPVLVIQGTHDTVAPPAAGEALQAAAPDRVSIVPIEGAGYAFPLTHVGATSWAIEDYLDWD